MAVNKQAIRKALIFFNKCLKRNPADPKERAYFMEWVARFSKGENVAMSYMDSARRECWKAIKKRMKI